MGTPRIDHGSCVARIEDMPRPFSRGSLTDRLDRAFAPLPASLDRSCRAAVS